MKHFSPLHGDPAPRMKHSPPLHGDPAPRMKHFPPLHGMDRAIMKFLSPTHTQNDQFPTIFSVLGRYFFHRGTQTTMRCYAGAIFLSCKPSKHPHRGGHRRNRAHLETQSLAAVLVGGGGAWPDNEPTHRAHISDQAPLVWRAPEGPEGTGGLRDRPLRAQLACGDLAGGPPPTGTHSGPALQGRPPAPRTPAGPHSDNMQRQRRAGGPPPTGTHSGRAPQSSPAQQVRPSGARNTSGATSTAGNQAISGSRAPSGSPTLRQHPSARAGAPNRRQPARGPRPRR